MSPLSKTFRILVILIQFLAAALSLPAATYIQAGAFWDGLAEEVRREVTMVVEGKAISAILDGYVTGENPEDVLIDLHGQTVLPGLIDLHVHLISQYSPEYQTERFFLNPADYALRSSVYARATLLAGFTTVRDLGDKHNVTISLKKGINAGWITGPRIFTSTKSIATTGGHADPTNGLCYHLMGSPGPDEGVVNGPVEAREAVRRRYKDGADCIKITATGGVLSLAKSGHNPQFMDDELQAIVETADDYGFTVAVHAHGDEGMQRAVLAGVTSIEHGTYMSEETMDLMKEHGTYYVPTVTAGRWVADKARVDGYFPEIIRPKAATIGPQIADTLAKAYSRGVRIAFGTDTGVSPHGENAQEFVYMVEAGMSELDALRSATSVAARVLRQEDNFGTLEAGKMADIIAVRGNPMEDISVLQSVSFVMKEGVVYKEE